MTRRVGLAAVLCGLLGPRYAAAEGAALAVEGAPAGGLGPWGLLLSVNHDDDDENRRPDRSQSPPPAGDDDVRIVAVAPPPGAAALALEADGGDRIRVHADPGGERLDLPASLGASSSRLLVDGVRASASAADVRLRARFLDASGAEIARADLPITVVGLAFLDGANAVVDATRSSLQTSNEVANGDSLPRGNDVAGTSPDPDNFRVEAFAPGIAAAAVRVEARYPGARLPRSVLEPLPMAGSSQGAARSPFLRLVADTMDWTAPGVTRRVLRADLRDRVSAALAAPDGQVVSTDLRVGRPGNEDGPQAARRGRWRIHVLRMSPGGPIALGVDEATARKIAADQIAAANEVYAACNVTFGPPEETPVSIADPPGPTMLSIGDADGLRSSGGEVRFTVNGTAVGPAPVGRNWKPHQTAAAVAQAIAAAGFVPEVSENAPFDHGAGRSADILVRDRSGALVRIAPQEGRPLTTDRRQSVSIGSVDLSDGLAEFNNASSSSGTLEERTMIKALSDDDPATIELFIVNRFTGGGRQGEAFIERDGGMIRNTLVLDRTGIRQSRAAWTQAHEAGHVLLDDPYHPDNFGEDRPWLLMDADASLADVTGPKRLSDDECARIERESGPRASPALLRRHDEVPADGSPAEHPIAPDGSPVDLGYPRP